MLYLHNPEQGLAGLPPQEADQVLAAASAAMADVVHTGLASRWGISSWNPAPLLACTAQAEPPHALMVRAGLLVDHRTLLAAETLIRRWNLTPEQVVGMSPFNAMAADPIWAEVDARPMLRHPPPECTALDAAFRVAFALPPVGAVAVGADTPAHLRALARTLATPINAAAVHRYRDELQRQAVQRTPHT